MNDYYSNSSFDPFANIPTPRPGETVGIPLEKFFAANERDGEATGMCEPSRVGGPMIMGSGIVESVPDDEEAEQREQQQLY